MGEVARRSPQDTEGYEACCHYWVIEFPSGPISKGVCKRCGCEREFFNDFKDAMAASASAWQESQEKSILIET